MLDIFAPSIAKDKASVNEESGEDDCGEGWADFACAVPNSSRTGEHDEEIINKTA